MKNRNSSGMDGLCCDFSLEMNGVHSDFYKAMLNTIHDYFYCLIAENLSSERLSKSLNQGLSKHITKNIARGTIGGWSLITFLSVSYIIMAKAMALNCVEGSSSRADKFCTGSNYSRHVI